MLFNSTVRLSIWFLNSTWLCLEKWTFSVNPLGNCLFRMHTWCSWWNFADCPQWVLVGSSTLPSKSRAWDYHKNPLFCHRSKRKSRLPPLRFCHSFRLCSITILRIDWHQLVSIDRFGGWLKLLLNWLKNDGDKVKMGFRTNKMVT